MDSHMINTQINNLQNTYKTIYKSIVKSVSLKHLGLILEENRTINDHINDKNGNQMNAIGLYFFTMFRLSLLFPNLP